jgi:RNase P subunit RPR2
MRVDIENKAILCCVCHRYVPAGHIRVETVLPDVEAMTWVCEDCRTYRRSGLPKILEEWCRSARPVCVAGS